MLRRRFSNRPNRQFRRNGSKGQKQIVRNEEKGGSTNQMVRMCMRAAAGRERVPQALPFPDRLRCILTYATPITLVNNSAVAGIYQFCGNDLFDPDFTSTGAQPMWFDQLSALYNRYRVYASAIHVAYMCPTTEGTTYARVCVAPAALTMASSAYDDIEAQPRAKFSVLNVNGMSRVTITSAATTSEIVGAKDVEGADRLQAQVTASPSERWLWVLSGISHAPAITAVTVNCEVRISYYCEFYDRRIVTMSQIWRKKHDEEKKSDSPILVANPQRTPSTFSFSVSQNKPKSLSLK